MSIGNEPITAILVLVFGQDFVHEILPPLGETIPAGTSIDLIFYDQAGAEIDTWDATVSSSVAGWNVDKAICDTIPDPSFFRIYVHYSDSSDYCWYAGRVSRQG